MKRQMLPILAEPKTCIECDFYLTGAMADFCWAYQEQIFSVRDAEICEMYTGEVDLGDEE